MRPLLILSTALFIFACSSNQDEPASSTPPFPENGLNVAFLIIDGVYNTELTAPYDIYQHTQYREGIEPMNVFTIANSLHEVRTSEGIRILPDYSYALEGEYPPIDILVIPSAEHSMDTDMGDDLMIEFVKRTDASAMYITSHCDGAFILAAAGLLDGVNCTTFPSDRAELQERFPEATVHDSTLFVHDGKYITSAGGAKSFEASLYLVELLYGKENADEIAQGMVIDWDLSSVPHLVIKKGAKPL